MQTVQTIVCSGSSLVLPNGNVLSNLLSNTIDTTVLTAISGCDSTIITQITVLPTYSTNTNASVCYGSSYTFPNGFVATGITAPFTQPSAFSTIDGCDSTIWTSIIVLPVYNMTVHDTICKQSNYTFPDGTIFTQIMVDTFHVNLLLSSMNCDSTVTTQIRVRSIDTSVSQAGPYFSANATGVSYQWLNCDTQQPISGETNQIFITTTNGHYAVIVSDMYCTDTSSCRQVSGLAVNDLRPSDLSIYPNPVLDHLIIDCTGSNSGVYKIRLTDMIGQTMMKMTDPRSFGQITLPLKELQPGFYLLHLETKDGKLDVRKIVKR
jgi:energy-converting hydrogenase Eha subunit A